MQEVALRNEDDVFVRRAVESAVRIGVLALIAIFALNTIRPFAHLVLWAIILAVAAYPLHTVLTRRLGGRKKLSAGLVTAAALAVLVIPSAGLLGVSVQEARDVAVSAEAGTLHVPPPPAGVRDWPLIGDQTYAYWNGASRNLQATLESMKPELVTAGKWGLASMAGLAGTVVEFFLSILVAGMLLSAGDSGRAFAVKFATRLAGPQGEDFVRLSVATIRSVFQGVLGIALIQAALSGVGLVLLGVPAAMLWALLVLVLAVMQLPPLLVLGPVMVWAFATQSTTAAVLFLIYALAVSVSDSFLKPLLLGRGVDVPMLVILLGAIGGMMTAGIIGLFVAAVVLAVAYQLLMAWLEHDATRGILPAEGDA